MDSTITGKNGKLSIRIKVIELMIVYDCLQLTNSFITALVAHSVQLRRYDYID